MFHEYRVMDLPETYDMSSERMERDLEMEFSSFLGTRENGGVEGEEEEDEEGGRGGAKMTHSNVNTGTKFPSPPFPPRDEDERGVCERGGVEKEEEEEEEEGGGRGREGSDVGRGLVEEGGRG